MLVSSLFADFVLLRFPKRANELGRTRGIDLPKFFRYIFANFSHLFVEFLVMRFPKCGEKGGVNLNHHHLLLYEVDRTNAL